MDKIKSLEKKIKDLLSESAKIKKENYKLKSENAKVKDENAKLKSENAKVKDENAKLKSENTNLKSENANLKTSSTQSTTPKESTQSTTTKDNLSKSSLYSQAVEWNYKDMQRNPEKYQGKVIAVTGKVFFLKWSMTDEDNYYYPNYYDIITPDGLVTDNFMLLVYDGILLTDDRISLVGYVEGYDMDFGDPRPIIKVAYLEFID